MELINIVLHFDKYLNGYIQDYGNFIYAILFIVIFCETGLVVIPFLPGDSLIFTIGAFCAIDMMDLKIIYPLLIVAAILGDTVNYHIGKFFGPKVFEKEKLKFLNKANLEKTQRFFDKYGGKTIIIARFVPIVRTFAPFVAGIGSMTYPKFLAYNIFGGLFWVTLFTFAGFFFGNLPIVKNNFTLVVYAIIFVSLLPAVIEYLRANDMKDLWARTKLKFSRKNK